MRVGPKSDTDRAGDQAADGAGEVVLLISLPTSASPGAGGIGGEELARGGGRCGTRFGLRGGFVGGCVALRNLGGDADGRCAGENDERNQEDQHTPLLSRGAECVNASNASVAPAPRLPSEARSAILVEKSVAVDRGAVENRSRCNDSVAVRR